MSAVGSCLPSKWRHFQRYWPFVRGIHRSSVDSPHKDQWAMMFSLMCIWTNGWANSRDVGDLRRHGAHYDVTVMTYNVQTKKIMPGTQIREIRNNVYEKMKIYSTSNPSTYNLQLCFHCCLLLSSSEYFHLDLSYTVTVHFTILVLQDTLHPCTQVEQDHLTFWVVLCTIIIISGHDSSFANRV